MMISGVDCSKIWIWFTSFNFFSGCSRYRRSSRAASREARRIGSKASTGNTAPPYLPVDMHVYRKIVYIDVCQTYNVTYIILYLCSRFRVPWPPPVNGMVPPLGCQKNPCYICSISEPQISNAYNVADIQYLSFLKGNVYIYICYI